MKLRTEKGITLIALVVTIIVLIILAWISINLILGENGLISKAKNAREETIKSSAIEKVQISVLASYNENGELLYGDLQNSEGLENNINSIKGLSKKIEAPIEKFPVRINVDGYYIEIQIDGQVEIININDSNKEDIPIGEYSILEHFDDEESKIVYSNVSLSNITKKYGESSAYFEGENYIQYASSSSLLSEDFTIDYWYYQENQSTTGYVPHMYFGDYALSFGVHNGNFTILQQSVMFITTSIPQMEAKKWTHVAITRQGTTMYVFFDGVLQGTYTVEGTLSTSNFNIGKDITNNYLTDAYIDELRILKGTAIWTDNFNVSDREYYDEEGTYVYHFNEENELKIRESEGNANISKDIKKIGEASIFLDSSYYKINESDDLKLEKDFTLDYWYYQTVNQTGNSYHLVSSNEKGIWIGINEGKFKVRTRGDTHTYIQFFETEQATINTWTHIALTRKDNILYFFIDGKLQNTFEYSDVIEKGDLYLGYDLYNYTTNTYIDELRILNGEAIWIEDFIPQTEPYKD